MSRLRPVVNWNIVGGCNYRCTYCVQKPPQGLGGPTDVQLDRALETLAALPGTWEIKLSGGEPFLLPRLPEVARLLARAGHRVSILTNLSPEIGTIAAFVEAAGDALRTFSCSLHREQVEEGSFLDKARIVKELLGAHPKATFVVNSVLVPGRIAEAAASRTRFEAVGIKFYPQWMRVQGQPADYSLEDLRRLEAAFGDLRTSAGMNRGYGFKGHPCHAGSRYFIVHPKGDAFACYPAKRHGEGRLGNLFDGTFRLQDGPAPCPYDVCPCTVPQNRGIVEKL